MTKEKQFARAKAIAVLECMAIDLTGSLAGLKEPNPMTDVLNQRLDAIDVAQEALREQPRWISVEERLPKEYQHIIGWTSWREIGEVYFNGKHFVWDMDYDTADVTHWMPLPEPPEVEV